MTFEITDDFSNCERCQEKERKWRMKRMSRRGFIFALTREGVRSVSQTCRLTVFTCEELINTSLP